MTLPSFDLSGRIAVVSGAARGLGKAMSIGIAEAGADLVLVDRDEKGLQETFDWYNINVFSGQEVSAV